MSSGGTDQPYLWRYREQKEDMEIDLLLLPGEGDALPEENGIHDGETTIVTWCSAESVNGTGGIPMTTAGAPSRQARNQYARSHYIQLEPLLDMDEPFIKSDLPARLQREFTQLVAAGVLTKEDKEFVHGGRRWKWTVNPNARQTIERRLDQTPTGRVTPCCEYRGFRNLRDGDYECSACETEFEEFQVIET